MKECKKRSYFAEFFAVLLT